MKGRTLFCLIALLFLLALPLSAAGEDAVSFDSLRIAEDGKSIDLHFSFPEAFSSLHDTVYLFRLPACDRDLLPVLTPVSEHTITGTTLSITLPYDASDPAEALYGYLLTIKDPDNRYLPLTDLVFPENFSDFAPNSRPYPETVSKKGLEVQLITDAQRLGVRHSVVTAYFNELIASDPAGAVTFLYGGIRYAINADALSALDYQVKQLSEAGIHLYLNLLLSGDPALPDALYYPDAARTGNALFLPNVSNRDGLLQYAAVLYFLAQRYSGDNTPYGFCGSFILGYETDRESDRSRAGLSADAYLDACAILLRTADTAIRSAYRNARLYLSVSNGWTLSGTSDPERLGVKAFLTALAARCPDVPFGISLNAYPSNPSLPDLWNDPAATDSPDTAIVSPKNLPVFTDFLREDFMRCGGATRRALIGEFGVSGRLGEESEKKQAAAFLYAFYAVCREEELEALIWHGHVDDAGDKNRFYGLWSASEVLLEPLFTKEIWSVFSAVDTEGDTEWRRVESCLSLLPADARETISRQGAVFNRVVYRTGPLSAAVPADSPQFDFSKNLYAFYPSDNADYLESFREEDNVFMRVRLFPASAGEYGGCGILLTDAALLHESDYLTVRLRVKAPGSTADIRLLLTGLGGDRDVVLDATATAVCGEWTELTFPLNGFRTEAFSSCRLKLWAGPDAVSFTAPEDLYLDVSSVSFSRSASFGRLQILYTVLILLAAAAVLSLLVSLFFVRRRRSRAA